MSRRTALALSGAILAACGGPRQVTIQVQVPDLAGVNTPVAGITVAALPYDRDSVIRDMERRAPTGRPNTETLDSLFQAFHGPFLSFTRDAWKVELVTRSRDSVDTALRRATPGTPGATELENRRRALTDSIARLTVAMEQSRGALEKARTTIWPRIESLKVAAHDWREATYAGYDTLVRRLSVGRMKASIADTTNAAGWATIRLVSPGAWWAHARAPDPTDPNFEWYWNVPITADSLVLSPATGKRLPRY